MAKAKSMSKASAKVAAVKTKVNVQAAVKKPRRKLGLAEAKAAAVMTKEAWVKFQVGMAEKWPKPDYMSEKREVVHVKDGGDGAYRNATYEIVTRWTAETNIAYRPHAKAPGSKSHVRYEKYATARTVGEALDLGCCPMDWCFDYEHGFLKVLGGTVRDEPLDISKVVDESTLTEVDRAIHGWFRRELAKRYGLDLKQLVVEKDGGESIIMRAHRLVAQRGAERRVAQAEKEGRRVTTQEVADTLSEWAFARNSNRQNVIPNGQQWVWSDTLGLLRDRQGDIHLTKASKSYPAVVHIINRWLQDRLPPEAAKFKWTSLNLNCNYAAKIHRDGNNFGPSMIAAFGDFTGGELNYFPEDDKGLQLDQLAAFGKDSASFDISKGIAMFNGNSAHWVNDFKGNRYSVVYFTMGCHAKASSEAKAGLADLSFPVPKVDEDPHALLRKPRGYGLNGVATPQGKKGQGNPASRYWACASLEKQPFAARKAASSKKVMKTTLKR